MWASGDASTLVIPLILCWTAPLRRHSRRCYSREAYTLQFKMKMNLWNCLFSTCFSGIFSVVLLHVMVEHRSTIMRPFFSTQQSGTELNVIDQQQIQGRRQNLILLRKKIIMTIQKKFTHKIICRHTNRAFGVCHAIKMILLVADTAVN